MVEQLSSWKNRCKVADSFDFNFDLNLVTPQIWHQLHIEQGLSAAQIAEKFGAPKSSILAILHRSGIRCETPKGRSTRADNYRAPSPPYGYKVRAGRLVEDTAEQKIIRLIVGLARDRGLNWSAIADELNQRKVPTKKSKGRWHRHMVRITFERWNNKL